MSFWLNRQIIIVCSLYWLIFMWLNSITVCYEYCYYTFTEYTVGRDGIVYVDYIQAQTAGTISGLQDKI